MIEKIGVWNIRGANDLSKQVEAKNLISSQNLSMLSFLENKLN